MNFPKPTAAPVADRADPDDASYRSVVTAFGEVAEALSDGRSLEGVELDRFLHLIAEKICDLVGVRRCSLYLRDERSDLFRGQVGHADHDIDAEVKRLVAGVPADRFTQEILRDRRPVLLRSALRDPRPIRSAMKAWRIEAMLGVPMVLRDEVIGIIFLDNEEQPHPFTELQQELAAAFAKLAADAIVRARMTAELHSSRDLLARRNAALRKAAAVEERLTALVLEEADFSRIAGEVSALTEHPCSIHDAEFARLGCGSADGSEPPGLLAPGLRGKPEVAAALAALDPLDATLVGPFPALGVPGRFLLAPVLARGEIWGHLVLAEGGRRFGAIDRLVARRAAMIVALEMSAEARAAGAHWDEAGTLLSELIRGDHDEDVLRRRAKLVGVELEAPHLLALVAPRSGSGTALPTLRDLGQALTEASSGRRVLAAGVAEGAILMLPVAADAPRRDEVARCREALAAALAAVTPDGSLIATLSSVCRSPADYPVAHEEVRSLFDLAAGFDGDGANAAIAIEDLGPGRMLLVGLDEPTGHRYVEDVLGPLLGSDDPHLDDLLLTLHAFLECSRSVRRCAELLGLHDNTIRYRLGRVEEILGVEITRDGEAQLNAQMALLLLRLRGRAPSLPSRDGEPLGDPTV